MNELGLFTLALGLTKPWQVADIKFSKEEGRLDLRIDFVKGAKSPCPSCQETKEGEVHDTLDRTWRHLNFFQYETYLHARVPRIRCGTCGVKQVDVPWARPGSGVPPLLAFLIAGSLFLVPFELGFLLYQAKKQNRSFSLKGIVCFRNKIPRWQYATLSALLLGWVFIIALAVNPPLEKTVIEKYFSWVPQPYFLESLISQAKQYSRSLLIISAVIGVFLNGIIGPIVEELYFRGYLLPRMSRLGLWAPFLNTVLFSLYHFFTPWQNPLRIMALTPVFYAVWRRKNIFLGIIVHCLMNLAGSLMLLVTILRLADGR